MGDDATNRWLFAGDSKREQASAHRQLRAFLKEHFARHGYERAPGDRAADRSLVLGPPARWIWIGDSFDSIDSQYSQVNPAVLTQRLDFRDVMSRLGRDQIHPGSTPGSYGPGELTSLLSHLGPLAKLDISDSAICSIYLYERGHEIDRYANGRNPFFSFSSAAQAEPWRGHPEVWKPLLVSGRTVDELRAAWTQAVGRWPDGGIADFHTISNACVDLLGLSWLLDRGYTWNPEGIPYRYTYRLYPSEQLDFTELHFRWPGSPGRGRWDRTR